MAGKSYNDRNLAARVRSKLLQRVEAILDGNNEAEKKELLLRMCGTLLPRLNAGRDDNERLNPLPLLNGKSNYDSADDSHEEVTPTEETN